MSTILILHSPDQSLEATTLSLELDTLEIMALTLGRIMRQNSRSDIQEVKTDLLMSAPAIIIMGSAEFFRDWFFQGLARVAINTKRHIFVLYDQGVYPMPDWFTNPIHLHDGSSDPAREWNRLVQILIRLTGQFDGLPPFKS